MSDKFLDVNTAIQETDEELKRLQVVLDDLTREQEALARKIQQSRENTVRTIIRLQGRREGLTMAQAANLSSPVVDVDVNDTEDTNQEEEAQ